MTLSLEGTLFLNAFKDFVDGKFSLSQKMYPLLTYDFPQIKAMLKHSRIEELVSFLNHIKDKEALNLQPKKIEQINQLISTIQSNKLSKMQSSYNDLIKEGIQFIKQNKQTTALQKFRQSIKIHPSEQAYIYIAVTELSHNKDIKSFIDNIHKALNFKENIDNLFLYEKAFDNIVEYNETVVKFRCAQRVVLLGSKNCKYYLELSQLGQKINENLKQYIHKIQENCPQSIEKYFSLGIIYFTLDKQQKCLNNLSKALDNINIYIKKKKLAQMKYRQTKNPTELQKLPIFDKIDKFYYYFGKAYERFNINTQAIEAYQIGLKYNNKNIDIWKQILKLFQTKPGYQSQRFEFVEQIMQFAGNDFEIHAIVVEILFEIGQRQVLALVAQSFLILYQNNDKYYYLAAKCYFKVINYAKSWQLCNKCIKVNAKNQDVYILIGLLYYQQKNYEQAKINFKKAIQLNPKQFLPYYNLALIFYNSQQYKQAVENCQAAISINPNFQVSIYLLIKSLLKCGNHQQAQRNVQQILRKDNENHEAIYCLAQIKFSSHQYDSAQKYYKNVMQKDPNHVQSIYRYSFLKAMKQDNNQDLEIAYQQIQSLLQKDMGRIKYISLQGYILIKSKRFEEAYRTLISGINKNKDYYQIYFHLGHLFKKYSKPLDRHAKQWQQFIQSDCENNYFVSLFYLGLEDYQNFLTKFNNYINFYKQKIIQNSKNKKEIHKVYKTIICDFEELIMLYPQLIDLYIILGILYRDINNASKSLQYCKKLIKDQQLLSENFIKFYNSNYHHHTQKNYIQFIYQFIFHQLFQYNTLEGMKFYYYLKQVNQVFNKSQDINHVITKKKQDIINIKIEQAAKIVKEMFLSTSEKMAKLFDSLFNRNDIIEQSSKNLTKLRKIFNLNNEQSITGLMLQDLLNVVTQSQQIANQESFAPILMQRERIASLQLSNQSGEFIYRVIRYLIVKYYYIQIYPFFYQSWEKSFLSELIKICPEYSSSQSIQKNIYALKEIVKSKLIKNQSTTKEIHISLSSQILFEQFQIEEKMIPLLQINKKQNKRNKILQTKNGKKHKGEHYLNTFQKQIIKQKLGYRSLINVSNRSSVFVSNNPSSIMNLEEQQWPQ